MARARQSAAWAAAHAPLSPRNMPPAEPGPYGDPFIPALSGLLTSMADGSVAVLPSASTPYAGDDAVFINTAFQYGTTVKLIDGLTYSTLTPVVIPSGRTLANTGAGTGQSVSGIGSNLGATIKPTAAWTAGGQPVAAAVIFAAGTRQALQGVDVDGRAMPAAVDAIALYDACNGVVIDRVAIDQPTGNGVAIYANAGVSQDGMNLSNMAVSRCGADGITGKCVDATMTNVHVQNCTGRGFYLTGSNTRLLGCRADSNAHGFVTDVFYGDGGGFTLAGCGTQSNIGHGLWAFNSAPSGNAARQPVTASACTFYGDGTDAASAAVQASGRVTLLLADCQILCDTNALLVVSPVFGVGTEKISAGAPPALVQVWGGLINAVTACINDAAPAALMSYRFHGVQGGSWNGNATPAAPSLFTLNS